MEERAQAHKNDLHRAVKGQVNRDLQEQKHGEEEQETLEEKEESEKKVGLRGDDMCSGEAWVQKRWNRGEENIVWGLKGLEQRRSGGHGIKCGGQVWPPWRCQLLGKLA